MKKKAFLILSGLLASLSLTSLVIAGPLGSGKYSSMSMLLEKTILKVDVLTLNVVVDQKTQGQLKDLIQGQPYSKELGDKAAAIAMKSEDAQVVLKFERDVSLDRWFDAVFENLDQAQKHGLIPKAVSTQVKNKLKKEFAKLDDRGYEENDKVIYRVKAKSLEVKAVSAAGQTLVSFTDTDKSAPGVVLASYLAPGSDFRVPLLKSLFK